MTKIKCTERGLEVLEFCSHVKIEVRVKEARNYRQIGRKLYRNWRETTIRCISRTDGSEEYDDESDDPNAQR